MAALPVLTMTSYKFTVNRTSFSFHIFQSSVLLNKTGGISEHLINVPISNNILKIILLSA